MPNSPDLYLFRETVGRAGIQPFDSTKATQSVKQIIQPIRQSESDLIKDRSPLILGRFEEALTRLGIKKGDIEPAALSAYYTTDVAVDRFMSNALRAQQDQHFPLLILFFDTDFGSSLAMNPILTASEPQQTQPAPDLSTILADAAKTRKQFFGEHTATSKQARVYKKMQDERERWAILFNETTARNPHKGFILLDERVRQLKALPNRLGPYDLPHYLVRKFVAAGADFSSAIFRAIYPVSEQFIASK